MGVMVCFATLAMTVHEGLIQDGSYGLLRYARNDGACKVNSGWELWFASLRSQWRCMKDWFRMGVMVCFATLAMTVFLRQYGFASYTELTKVHCHCEDPDEIGSRSNPSLTDANFLIWCW